MLTIHPRSPRFDWKGMAVVFLVSSVMVAILSLICVVRYNQVYEEQRQTTSTTIVNTKCATDVNGHTWCNKPGDTESPVQMKKFTIQTTQAFNVTYEVEADSPEGAWQALLDAEDTTCVDQQPAEIIGAFNEADIS